ncbi:MAG: hypothetical protein COA79_17435 [Planctomycetota bacterium]|nr:MAG: hypothetical protein COA79_17435 [Planctomycetota bacterium]
MNDMIFIGSSIFEGWSQPRLPSFEIYNFAVGGTTTGYWLENIKSNIKPGVHNYAFYCGSNDLNAVILPDKIIENTNKIFNLIKTTNSRIQIAYFSIMKAPQKSDKFEIIDYINSNIKSKIRGNDIFIDLNSIIDTNPKWYQDDELHLNELTYTEIENKFGAVLSQWAA